MVTNLSSISQSITTILFIETDQNNSLKRTKSNCVLGFEGERDYINMIYKDQSQQYYLYTT